MARRMRRPLLVIVPAALLTALGACGGGGPGGTAPTSTGLSIAAPVDGQVLSGTVAVAASGVGGTAEGVQFQLDGLSAMAAEDGTATLNTRGVADASYTLTASAQVGGEAASDSISVMVVNDLASSGTVGPDGGALRSDSGSIATLPPEALSGSVTMSLRDTSQDEILDEFGIDYPALGVTFLGALTLDADAASPDLPVQVDLAGWAEAVQPEQTVVMFSAAPDVDGDGVGELTFAAAAQATGDGSVVTRPVPRSEVDGFGETAGSVLQQAADAKPGEIVTVVGRGFNPSGWLSNVARFDGDGEVLAWAVVTGDAAFNPLMEVRFAVPSSDAGGVSVRLHNLTTGYRTDPIDVRVGAVGSGDAATWTAFLDQIRTAVEASTRDRPDLASLAESWWAVLEATDSDVAAAMAGNSGLVSSANRSTLEGIGAEGPFGDERDLIVQHALVLDAIAVSDAALSGAAADLATLLAVGSPAPRDSNRLRTAQAGGGGGCSGTASSSSSGVVFGNPTGMGSASPGACASGGGAGPGGGGPAVVASADRDAATTSLRSGAFRPVEGAIVGVYRPDGGKLSPFTALTDASGFFTVPFIPPGEPFTVRAVDPATGHTARYDGVAGAVNESVPIHLLFGNEEAAVGAPTASFDVAPAPRGSLPGTWWYEFDASESSDPDGEIAMYRWDLAGYEVPIDWMSSAYRGFGRNGVYDISLVVIDDHGHTARATRQLVIDDLPYDYWGTAPERVNETADGSVSDREVNYDFATSADGRYVTFGTKATNLDPDDANLRLDVYLKDMTTGEVELVSRGAAGFASEATAMSSDARYLSFTEEEIQPFGSGPRRTVMVDRQQGTEEEPLAGDGFGNAFVTALSGDGRTLVFFSDGGTYVKDLDTGEIHRLGLTRDGETYAKVRFARGAISRNGRHVVFSSLDGNLVENDTNDREDVFVTDLDAGETVRVSETSGGVGGNQNSRAWGKSISDDGRYVVFTTQATNFLSDDVNGTDDDVFVKDLETGALELISANLSEAQADAASVLPVISGDGRYVAFGSYATNLVPELDPFDPCLLRCPQGFSYVKDRATGRVVQVTMGMNGLVPDDWDQVAPIISGDGRYVGFASDSSNLVEGDVEETEDFYRAENPLWEP